VNLQSDVHKRHNPLTDEWVLVSPHRTQRPWQGQTEPLSAETLPRHDPNCYLCPGNLRAGGQRNPLYTATHVFDNDFAALKPAAAPEAAPAQIADAGLLLAQRETGVCRVVCFSPDHSMTLAGMPCAAIEVLIQCWTEHYRELGARPDIEHVQIFENRGGMMGASNPHPHGQIWANLTLPNDRQRDRRSTAIFT
jgi:UDPglucose--hexose-1-phosphate uridylyltransferase